MRSKELRPLPNKETIEFGGRSFTVERFFEGQISDDEKLKLTEELTPLTGQGFLRFDVYSNELKTDVIKHVLRAPRLIIIRDENGKSVAYIASGTFVANDGTKFYDLGGIIVDPPLHSLRMNPDSRISLAQYLLTQELESVDVEAIILRTQSQKMYNLAAKVADIDPKMAAYYAPEAGYDRNLVGNTNRQAYRQGSGECLYDDIETFSREAINVEGFDWLHGDAMVVAGFLKF